MATPLDMGILQHVKIVFPLLMVFIVVFAGLEKTKVLGEANRSLNAVLSVCVSALLLLSPNMLKVLTVVTPWFVFAIIAITFFIVIFLFAGYTMDELTADMTGEWGFAQWFLLVVFIIFIIGGLSTVYGQTMLPWSGDENVAPGGQYGEFIDENGTRSIAPMDRVRADQAKGDYSTNTGDFQSNVGKIVFHPKILGAVLILIIFSFAIRMLASSE
ncbi:hypothetical protein HN419_02890 [Candidatus Woesearchaeota archaeon]|jgi:hypothetical protein|nr:hypothetical protein [Candidatus Woesearchaeota archaeon]MBT3537056.1 hypothetical protein [Candidatus Woesearchaeota archaeon]MBT7106634.1 hypothetical protein [Candidatus Woesearchaeota archaeon]